MGINREEVGWLANAFLGEGRLEEAILELGKLLVDKPMDLVTRNRLADLYLQTGRVELGIRYLVFIADCYERDGFLCHAKFFISILRAIILRGVGISASWDQIVYLLIFTTILIVLASIIGKRKAEST